MKQNSKNPELVKVQLLAIAGFGDTFEQTMPISSTATTTGFSGTFYRTHSVRLIDGRTMDTAFDDKRWLSKPRIVARITKAVPARIRLS